MATISIIAAVMVGAVLIVAGVSKLVSGEQWTSEARALGAPAAVIPFVPWVEIVLGALLVTQVARVVASILALGIFVVFTIVIFRALRAGNRPPCACFGAWSTSELGARHVVRNGVLIALSLVAAL